MREYQRQTTCHSCCKNHPMAPATNWRLQAIRPKATSPAEPECVGVSSVKSADRQGLDATHSTVQCMHLSAQGWPNLLRLPLGPLLFTGYFAVGDQIPTQRSRRKHNRQRPSRMEAGRDFLRAEPCNPLRIIHVLERLLLRRQGMH
jgi:hypothetical protein